MVGDAKLEHQGARGDVVEGEAEVGVADAADVAVVPVEAVEGERLVGTGGVERGQLGVAAGEVLLAELHPGQREQRTRLERFH